MDQMMDKAVKIEHIALAVKDLKAARDFFVKYFKAESNDGYRNPSTGFRSYFLTFDGGARLELTNRPETAGLSPSPAEIGYSHIAFSVGSKEEVDRFTAVLKADGYEVIGGPRTTGDGYYESCVVGIEGNRIEITI